jgi:hypothetical protein
LLRLLRLANLLLFLPLLLLQGLQLLCLLLPLL